jgi:DNA-binding CsgD family transcriptional regulator
VAHNSSLELLRHRRATAELCDHHLTGPDFADAAPDGQRERLDALVTALSSLPVRQRRAIVMRELEGRSYDEIAARLDTSNGAVRQLLNRARTSIRERLGALIPVELVLRWTELAARTGSSRTLTLAGSGTLAAKISSVILLSAAPVVAVAPMPGGGSHAPATRAASNETATRSAVSAGQRHPQPGSESEQRLRFELAHGRRARAIHGHRELAPGLRHRRNPRRRTPADRRAQLIGSRRGVVAGELAERAVRAPDEHLLAEHALNLGARRAGPGHSVAAAIAAWP